MGNNYQQLSHFESSINSEEKNFKFVLSWDTDNADKQIKIHQGPRIYTYLNNVDISSCEFMFIKEKEIYRWHPQIIFKNGQNYLEMQKELREHGLKFKTWNREKFQLECKKQLSRKVICSSVTGNIGAYGFFDTLYSYSDWPRNELNIYFPFDCHTFGNKLINEFESHYAGGENKKKYSVAKKIIEKCKYTYNDVANFLAAFNDIEYDFLILMRGNNWNVFASSDIGLKINGEKIEPPEGIRKDTFNWMIPYILKMF